MATTFLDPGGDATFNANQTNNAGLYGAITGNSIVSDIVHGTHIKSMQNSVNSTGVVTTPTSLQDAGGRMSFYFYIKVLPAATHAFFAISTIASTIIAQLKLTSGGVLQLHKAGASQIGSNGATLSTGVWYRISMAYTITSASVNRFEVFVDGTSSISVTNAASVTTASDRMKLGSLTTDTTGDYRYSDIYIDDSSSLTDTGNIWVTAKRPVSNGTTNNFTTQIGAGGSGYGSGNSPQVNERAVSSTNGWSVASTAVLKTEEYTIEAASVGDIDISTATIIDSVGWIYAQLNQTSGVTSQIIVKGTATTKTLTTAPIVYTQAAGSAVYPAGNTDIGMNFTPSGTITTGSLFECGIMVAYTPSVGGAVSSGNMFEMF